MKKLLLGLLAVVFVSLAVFAFPWFFPPKSEITVVNAASAPIREGKLRIGEEHRDLGFLPPGARRTFRYRPWREGDFGLQIRFDFKSVSDDYFGYIVGVPWPHPQFDLVEVDEQGVRPTPTPLGKKAGASPPSVAAR